MKLRIAIWAIVGALVAVFWRLYLSATFPNTLPGAAGTLLDLTCPIALLRHHAMSFYSVLLANAATYALIGAIVEMLRHHKSAPDVRANHAN